jgi:hypothetical protein
VRDRDLERRARLVLVIADALEREGRPFAGVLRDVARAVLERPALEPTGREPTGSACRRCGGPLPTPGPGRPRVFCLACSPKKAGKLTLGA